MSNTATTRKEAIEAARTEFNALLTRMPLPAAVEELTEAVADGERGELIDEHDIHRIAQDYQRERARREAQADAEYDQRVADRP